MEPSLTETPIETAPTRAARSDRGKPRETLFVNPSPAVRLDLQHQEARDTLRGWIAMHAPMEGSAEKIWAVVEEILAHLDRLRRKEAK